jgi:hypothetical protein
MGDVQIFLGEPSAGQRLSSHKVPAGVRREKWYDFAARWSANALQHVGPEGKDLLRPGDQPTLVTFHGPLGTWRGGLFRDGAVKGAQQLDTPEAAPVDRGVAAATGREPADRGVAAAAGLEPADRGVAAAAGRGSRFRLPQIRMPALGRPEQTQAAGTWPVYSDSLSAYGRPSDMTAAGGAPGLGTSAGPSAQPHAGTWNSATRNAPVIGGAGPLGRAAAGEAPGFGGPARSDGRGGSSAQPPAGMWRSGLAGSQRPNAPRGNVSRNQGNRAAAALRKVLAGRRPGQGR